MARKIRVMIVDDHPVVRQGIASVIEGEDDVEVAAQAATVEEAVALCLKIDINVVLLDLRLGGESGVSVIERVAPRHPQIKFVVFTTYDDDEDIYRALDAGARGYLLKDTFGDEILDTLRAVAAGFKRIPDVMRERMSERKALPALSARELDVLALIVRGLSNKEIAAALGISEGTVKTHVVHILEKLDVTDRTAAATQALRRGLIRPD